MRIFIEMSTRNFGGLKSKSVEWNGLTWFVVSVASMPSCRAVPLLAMWSGRDFDLNHCRAVNWTSDCCFVVQMMDTIFVPIPIRVLAMVTPSWSSPVRVRRNAALSRYQPLDHKRKCWRINSTHSMPQKIYQVEIKKKTAQRYFNWFFLNVYSALFSFFYTRLFVGEFNLTDISLFLFDICVTSDVYLTVVSVGWQKSNQIISILFNLQLWFAFEFNPNEINFWFELFSSSK